MTTGPPRLAVLLSLVVTAAAGCASLGSLRGFIQPPRFDQSPDRQAEIRLFAPSVTHPLGGAGVRIWTRVVNPNPFGFTLASLRGTLFLEESRAADVDLPLGLPLSAGVESEFPIDVSIGFAELPRLGDVIRRAVGRQPIGYRLDGTVGVEAGRFGTPTFGPMTIVQGTAR